MLLLILFFLFIILPILAWRGTVWVLGVYYHGRHLRLLRLGLPLLASLTVLGSALYLVWLLLNEMFSGTGVGFVGPT